MNILVTGTTGFIGSAFIEDLNRKSNVCTYELRRDDSCKAPSWVGNTLYVKSLEEVSDWSVYLEHIDVVVHIAALASENHANSIQELNSVNRDATINLARGAAKAGVRHFVFISTICVSGSDSVGQKISEHSCNPYNAYASSKKEAEDGIRAICQNAQMRYSIIRPPLVYGKGVKGNFALLDKLTTVSRFTPFGLCNAPRSFISIYNLVDIMLRAVELGGDNETYVVSDGQDMSIKDFVSLMAKVKKKKLVHIPFPKITFMLLGKSSMIPKLFLPLEVDTKKVTQQLNWKPSCSTLESMQRIFNH